MRFFKDTFIIVVCLAFFALVWTGWQALQMHRAQSAITTFEECAAKYPVMESYPEQCVTPDGKRFVGPLSSGPVVAP